MLVNLRDEREREVGGIKNVVNVVVLVRGLGKNVLERLKAGMDYGGSQLMVQEGIAAVADRRRGLGY